MQKPILLDKFDKKPNNSFTFWLVFWQLISITLLYGSSHAVYTVYFLFFFQFVVSFTVTIKMFTTNFSS